MPLSCVIFDIDGTIARTNELIFASFNHVIARHRGAPMAPAEIIRLFGPPEEGAFTALFGADRAGPLMEEFCEYYRDHHAAMASLHAGVDRILADLRARHIPLAVFTGKGTRTTAITLEALGVRSFFDFIVTGNDVANHKPHPEGILRILEHFRVSPAEALMVGDSPADIAASRAAGVPIASVLWDCYDPGAVAAANGTCLFRSVPEMERWLHTQFRD